MNNIKEYTTEALYRARAIIEKEGQMDPIVITIKGEEVLQSSPLTIDNNIETFLKEKTKTSDTIVIIMDTFYKEVKKSANEEHKNLSQDPNACGGLLGIIFTKEKADLKLMPYVEENGSYTFMNQDWMKPGQGKGLKNPFTIS